MCTYVSEAGCGGGVETCHGTCLVEVDGVGLQGGFLFGLVWVLEGVREYEDEC